MYKTLTYWNLKMYTYLNKIVAKKKKEEKRKKMIKQQFCQ